MNARAAFVVLVLVGFTVGMWAMLMWATLAGNLVVAGTSVIAWFVGFEVVYRIVLKSRIMKWIEKS